MSQHFTKVCLTVIEIIGNCCAITKYRRQKYDDFVIESHFDFYFNSLHDKSQFALIMFKRNALLGVVQGMVEKGACTASH